MRNRGGLSRKLLISHAGVALAALLSIVLLVNIVMNVSFNQYQKNQERAEIQTLLEVLKEAYNESTSQWNTNVWMMISHQAMVSEYIVRVYDKDHQLIWDTSQMGMQREVNSQPKQDTITKAIVKDNQQVGTLEFQPVNETSQSQNQQFLRMFNTLLWAAMILVIAGTYLFSRYMAKSISKPLLEIKDIASRMREGDLTSRVEVINQNTEIDDVGRALNHLAEGLEKQDQLRKSLTADVAHELRTPLTTIQSHLEAFQDGIWEPTPNKLQVCHDQVLRLVRLISDLENLAAVENPMVQLKTEIVSLNDIVEMSLNTVSSQFRHKGLTADLISTNDVWITGDRSRLVQVFVNLISNAFKYTSSGSIHIEVLKEKAEGVVIVSDTGMGIPEGELSYIFERFYRGEKSRNRKTGGAGIGLAVVKAIVDAHAGSIHVESENKKGTTVCVRLPLIR
ncbi:two-component sensor histidine kinase [Paenibacillus sp. VTT E-133280]|uniref:sensor histidine kinase n=1 Tax=unclassified Paenibacillus TaxID=185978 RepID=UPI000BA0F6EA|nr:MULTISPECIES: ATP-binding protein [unclassified Paenibacillus]MBY3621369.1 HAMP domain-containing protein [Acinetobacter sp. CUI P1]MDH6373023.1 two-component system sensor histidine kinase BaeS [Paenibacillus sp. PastF-3]OZQ59335.1 two-component sensor histidine kinase [Paenibacillus sp. VTT E-133280]OZQ80706.1 two-component sensor histidine kinase [Paenibacillus sp. VTT E-133291]